MATDVTDKPHIDGRVNQGLRRRRRLIAPIEGLIKMTKWEYTVLSSWWVESDREETYVTRISYRHVWQPGDEVMDYCKGITAHLGAEGWELVAITTQTGVPQLG